MRSSERHHTKPLQRPGRIAEEVRKHAHADPYLKEVIGGGLTSREYEAKNPSTGLPEAKSMKLNFAEFTEG